MSAMRIVLSEAGILIAYHTLNKILINVPVLWLLLILYISLISHKLENFQREKKSQTNVISVDVTTKYTIFHGGLTLTPLNVLLPSSMSK